jgi:hypothetical protein
MRCTNQYIQNNINIESTDSLWNRFKNDLLQAIRKYIPHKTCSTQNRPPWIAGKVKK